MVQAQAGKTLPNLASPTVERTALPFPVDRKTYDSTIQTLHEAIEEAKLEKKDKYNAVKRLEQYAKP